MNNTKYIRHVLKGFILWDAGLADISHVQMATLLGLHLADLHSAGFVQWHGGMPLCNGMSGSLGIGCKPGDSQALMRQLGLPQPVDAAERRVQRGFSLLDLPLQQPAGAAP